MSYRLSQTIWLFLGILFVFSFFAISVNQGNAAPDGLPTRPTDSPTATATAVYTPTPTAVPPTATPVPIDTPKAYGAYIQLQVSGHYNASRLWTIVQWQDTNGGWHHVEGWQGTLDDGFSKTWWVAPEDFNTGPFRWTVYDGKNGVLSGTSDSFYLPKRTKEVTLLTIEID